MKQKTFPYFFLSTTLALLLSIVLYSCDSCTPVNNEEEEEVQYFDIDTGSVYDISYNTNDNIEVMYTRVPGDPRDGIRVRKIKDSGTHHERVVSGQLLRGTYRIDSPIYYTAFVYAIYNSDTGCRESRWYSWVNPTMEVAKTLRDTFAPMRYTKEVKATTELKFKFDQWNEDYQKKWVDTTNRSRRRAGLREFPEISPSDSLKKGKPYRPLRTPEGMGFLDAPIFSKRLPRSNKATVAETMFARYKKIGRCVKNNRGAPPADTGIIRITTRAMTYLYCIDRTTPECIGYFTWTTVETDTVMVSWVKAQSGDCERAMGLTGTRWAPRFTLKGGTTVSVGPWRNCD